MWNLRLVKTEVDIQGEIVPMYQMAEVYYDSMGKPMGWCPAESVSEDIEDLKTYTEWMLEAFGKPVVIFNDHKSAEKTL